MQNIMLLLCFCGACFVLGYVASWYAHGQLIKRIKNTLHYMKKGHTPLRAWRFAGVTL
jgi:hypothetical protein